MKSDVEQLNEVLARYSQTIDDRDFGGFSELLCDDAVLEVAARSFEGRENIVRAVEKANSRKVPGKHICTNIVIQLLDGEADVASDYFYFDSDRNLVEAGRYIDHFVKTEGRWYISRRNIVPALKRTG